MKKIIFDSYALIALFNQEAGFEKVRGLLVEISQNKIEGYISAVNVGEVYYMISRKSNPNQAEKALNALLHMPIKIVDADLKFSLEAARIKANFSLSFADAYAAALTIREKGKLLTGDKEFETLINLKDFKVIYL